jgi:cell division protein FtsA
MGKKKNNGKANRDIIVGLDLGTTKTSVIIAERHENALNLVGLGTSPALGMKQGIVVNIEGTVESIVKAVEAAEQMANLQVESVWASIAGDHIKSVNSRGMIAVGRSKNGLGTKISREDIQRVIETAQTVTFPADREVLHVIPQEFLVDDRNGFKDPVGIVGTRLEANVHIITAALSAAQTMLYCLQEAGVGLEDLVLQPLASALSTLTNDDRELGVALVDVGGGTADIAVFYDGSIRHTAVISLGGDNVTRDLAHGLRTPMHVAEKIKLEHGCAHPTKLSRSEPVVIPGGEDRADRHVSQDILCAIIQPRMEEIFDLVVKELRQADCLHKLTAGVALTGGAALVPGAVDIGEEVFNLPVRLARPASLNGLREMANSPIYATSAGLIMYGARQQDAEAKGLGARGKVRRQEKLQGSKIQNFKRWLGDIF